jgi:hypothetical protein
VDIHSKLIRARSPRRRRGIALPIALFALVVVGALVTVLTTIADLQIKATRNRVANARALLLAEEAAVHALILMRDTLANTELTAMLRGSDGNLRTGDDGLLIGHGIGSDKTIPAEGRASRTGRYTVQLFDDDAEADGDSLSDTNDRVVARCVGTTADGATALIDVAIGSVPFPAMATEGDLQISGNPELVGRCGGAHANHIMIVSGTPIVSGNMSASDTVQLSGHIRDTLNRSVTPLSHAPPIDIPDLDPLEYCATADFVLQADGYVLDRTTGQTHDARSNPQFGWKLSSNTPPMWDFSGNVATTGTFCAMGNAIISGNPGSGSSPANMSLIATGSIKISGNPYLAAEDPNGIVLLAGGDVSVSGNPSAISQNYRGLVYAGSQCEVSGNPRLGGQLLCKDKPNPPGAENWVTENKLNGNAEISFDCVSSITGKRKVVGWVQR